MYAVVDIAGQQYKIEKDKKLFVNRIEGEVDSKVNFSKVLFIDNDGKVKIGTPYVKDASVTAKILSHIKGNKVKVFRKKRRKGFKVLNGFRHYLTEVLIENISEVRLPEKATAKKETSEKTIEKTVSVEVKAPEKETEKKAAGTKTISKPTAGKKETPIKAETKSAAGKKQASVKKEVSSKKSVTKKAPAVKAPAAKSKTAQSKTTKKAATPKNITGKENTAKGKSKASKKAANKGPDKTVK